MVKAENLFSEQHGGNYYPMESVEKQMLAEEEETTQDPAYLI